MHERVCHDWTIDAPDSHSSFEFVDKCLLFHLCYVAVTMKKSLRSSARSTQYLHHRRQMLRYLERMRLL